MILESLLQEINSIVLYSPLYSLDLVWAFSACNFEYIEIKIFFNFGYVCHIDTYTRETINTCIV